MFDRVSDSFNGVFRKLGGNTSFGTWPYSVIILSKADPYMNRSTSSDSTETSAGFLTLVRDNQ